MIETIHPGQIRIGALYLKCQDIKYQLLPLVLHALLVIFDIKIGLYILLFIFSYNNFRNLYICSSICVFVI